MVKHKLELKWEFDFCFQSSQRIYSGGMMIENVGSRIKFIDDIRVY